MKLDRYVLSTRLLQYYSNPTLIRRVQTSRKTSTNVECSRSIIRKSITFDYFVDVLIFEICSFDCLDGFLISKTSSFDFANEFLISQMVLLIFQMAFLISEMSVFDFSNGIFDF